MCSGAAMNRAGKELLPVRPVMQSWLASMAHGILVEVFLRGGAQRESLISVFKEFSSSIGGAFILTGGWALRYHSMGFRHWLSFYGV